MKIYDISQEVFTCVVYPGDTAPSAREVCRISEGDLYNLTDITMCAHNGTHLDAPFHFFGDGKTVDKISLEKTIGYCHVVNFNGIMSADDAAAIIAKATDGARRKILLKGDAIVTREAAQVFAELPIDLIGVESQSVGDSEKPMEVHKILLSKGIVLLEGIRLGEVSEGEYFLNAAPINFGGIDGAPCRAVLIS